MSDETSQLEVPAAASVPQASALTRPGYGFKIPGVCLEPGAPLWSDAQRRDGIWLEMVYLTPSEEEDAINVAVSNGKIGSAPFLQMRRSLWAIDGAKINHADREFVWKYLGVQGRQLAQVGFQMANTPSAEVREVMAASFRVTG